MGHGIYHYYFDVGQNFQSKNKATIGNIALCIFAPSLSTFEWMLVQSVEIKELFILYNVTSLVCLIF